VRNESVANRKASPGDGTPAPTAPIIEGYTIERELGRGGEAIVYLARETATGRRVAIKVLRPELAASLHAERFLQEIEIISGFVHPNILPLIKSGRTADTLYYVAPYVDGESLRAHLKRQGQLSVDEAVRIVREVAYALDYACRHSVVHRDIKPENILLADGHALVADFGFASAVTLAGDHRFTAKGLAVGTPAYMSPEQAGADARIDGRSDIYSLGCVLYELLAGSPPIRGITPQQVLAQHLAAEVPPLWHVRRTVPSALEDVILKALAKAPADRYPTAGAFADALGTAVVSGSSWREGVHRVVRRVRWPRTVAMLGVAVALLVAGVLVTGNRGGAVIDADRGGQRASPTDGRIEPALLRIAVLPVDGPDTVALRTAGAFMRDALKRWRDVSVEDEVRVAEALGTRRTALRLEEARRIASTVGAGRYVRIGVERVGDSISVSAGMYDAKSDTRVADGSVRVAAAFTGAEPAFTALADTLLFPPRMRPARADRPDATRSVLARDAYLRGHVALVEWNLPLADSLFDAARLHDPQYASALLWLAQVRMWQRRPLPVWHSAAVQASARRTSLAPADTLAADGLAALATGRTETACALLGQSASANSADFAAWYSYASCLRSDSVVIRDPATRSGWRFRTNYSTVLDAYQRAFQLLPSVAAFNDLGRVLNNTVRLRPGRAAPPDTLRFRAYPAVEGDSIVFHPFPLSSFEGAQADVRDTGVNAAIIRKRELYRDIALGWRSAAPRSPGALEAVAISLDLFADPAAIDTLRAARRLAETADDRVRLAVLEVWGTLKGSLPNDLRGLTRAKALADSILDANPPPRAPQLRLLAGIASLLGRANLAAEYARAAAAEGQEGLPETVSRHALALLAHASLGGPSDTLAALELAIERGLAPPMSADGMAVTTAWVLRAATIAFPDYRSRSLAAATDSRDYVVALEGAFLRGDTTSVRRGLERVRTGRALIPPQDITFDALYPEAALVRFIDGPDAASRWLDPTLESLGAVPTRVLADGDGARAGPLMRAIALRADLADQQGDAARARLYARAIVTLWSDADPFLRVTVVRMKRLSR
jgi:tRNA A-37 threonylcarbamoyl transferase component Bud32/tetratricopeptide (TPR) repeat protein